MIDLVKLEKTLLKHTPVWSWGVTIPIFNWLWDRRERKNKPKA